MSTTSERPGLETDVLVARQPEEVTTSSSSPTAALARLSGASLLRRRTHVATQPIEVDGEPFSSSSDSQQHSQQHLLGDSAGAPTATAGGGTSSGGGGLSLERVCGTLNQRMRWLLPPIQWLPAMSRQSAFSDVIAGLVVGVVFIPQVIAYAAIIDAPLQPCLISACIFSFAYCLMGNVPALSMGPTAEVFLMLASIPNLPTDQNARAAIFQSVALQVGIMAFLASFVEGGVIIRNTFSKAVGDAFACAGGIIIALGQVKTMFNVATPNSILAHEIIGYFITAVQKSGSINSLYSFIFFLALFGYLMGSKKLAFIPKWFPHQLLVVVVSILITWLASLNQKMNLRILKSVPDTGYRPTIPPMDLATLGNTGVTSAVVMLVGFLQMYSVGTKVSVAEVPANKELVTFSITSIVAGLFGGVPGSAAFSRCSILDELKVSSTLCHFVGATVVAVAMAALFRLGIFYSAVQGLVHFGQKWR